MHEKFPRIPSLVIVMAGTLYLPFIENLLYRGEMRNRSSGKLGHLPKVTLKRVSMPEFCPGVDP